MTDYRLELERRERSRLFTKRIALATAIIGWAPLLSLPISICGAVAYAWTVAAFGGTPSESTIMAIGTPWIWMLGDSLRMFIADAMAMLGVIGWISYQNM